MAMLLTRLWNPVALLDQFDGEAFTKNVLPVEKCLEAFEGMLGPK